MKKIFKKSLAIMVSSAICLTALIGCLSVSAANGEAPVYTVATVEGKKGETVGVNVTGADLTEICGQDLSIIFAKGLTIGTVHDNITNEDLICDPEGDGMQYNVIANDDGTNTVKMVDIINFPEYGEGESYNPALVTGTLDVTISVTIPADAAAGTEYPITIDESQFADYDEEWVRPTLNGGKITVVEDATEPVLDESIAADARAIVPGSTLQVEYAFDASALDAYDSFYLEVVRNKCDGSFNFVSDTVEMTDPILYKGKYYFYYEGIALYEMNISVTAKIYCKDSEGNVVAYSNTYTDTLVDLAKALYNSTSETKTKAILTDLLNMGAEAQLYFGGRFADSDLADVELANKDFDQTYATTELTGLSNINSTVVESGTSDIAPVVAIGSTPYITYEISDSTQYTEETMANLSLNISYFDPVLKDTISATISGSDMILYKGVCYTEFSNMPLYGGNLVVTAELYSGDTKLLTNQYCIETYIVENAENESMGDILTAIGKFGISARVYYGVE